MLKKSSDVNLIFVLKKLLLFLNRDLKINDHFLHDIILKAESRRQETYINPSNFPLGCI